MYVRRITNWYNLRWISIRRVKVTHGIKAFDYHAMYPYNCMDCSPSGKHKHNSSTEWKRHLYLLIYLTVHDEQVWLMKSSTVLLGKKEKKRKVKDISVVLSHSICQIEMRDFRNNFKLLNRKKDWLIYDKFKFCFTVLEHVYFAFDFVSFRV